MQKTLYRLKKIVFKIFRILLFVLSFLTIVFQVWMISWIAYNEVTAKKLRKKLESEFSDCIAKNDQKELDKLFDKYKKNENNFNETADKLKQEAKKAWFTFQILRQKAFVNKSKALEYSFYMENIKNINLKNYFVLKDLKRNLVKN